MTLEEALSKVIDLESKTTLQKIINDQNKYIGQLESQLKAKATEPTPVNNDNNSITHKYIEKRMREDTIAEAKNQILAEVGADVYNAVEPDFTKFLEENMTLETTNIPFVVDAFSLVYGRCYRNKEHPVHKIGKATPSGTPTNTPSTNGPQVQGIQKILSEQPPMMTNRDPSSAMGTPVPGQTTIKTTKDAFASLKNRFNQNGGSKFQ